MEAKARLAEPGRPVPGPQHPKAPCVGADFAHRGRAGSRTQRTFGIGFFKKMTLVKGVDMAKLHSPTAWGLEEGFWGNRAERQQQVWVWEAA